MFKYFMGYGCNMRSDMFTFQTLVAPGYKNVERFFACLDGIRFNFFEVNGSH